MPGQRRSPFIGKREPIANGAALLYQRPTSVNDLLLEPAEAGLSVTEPMVSALAGQTATKNDKAKKRKRDAPKPPDGAQPAAEQAVAADAGHVPAGWSLPAAQVPANTANGAEGPHTGQLKDGKQPEAPKQLRAHPAAAGSSGQSEPQSEEGPPKKQRKPRSEKRAARQAARAAKQSGAGNAEEALRIRGLLGLVPEGPTPAAPAAGAAAPAVVADATPAGFRVSDLFAAGTAQAAAEPADSSEDDGEAEGPGSAPAAQTPGRFSFNFAMAAGKEEPAGQAGCSDSEPAEQQQQQLPPKPGGGSSKPDGGSAARQGSTAAEAEAKDFVPRRVFVGGMPFHYEEDAIREFWEECGAVEDLDLMRFPDTGRFKGIAFITFATEAGCEAALEYNGTMLDEQRIKVERCTSAGPRKSRQQRRDDKGPSSKARAPAPKTPGYPVAYVGNIGFDVHSSELRKLFEDCNVTKVRLHTDKDTGKSKGFAHIHFADDECLDRAMSHDGTELGGRRIKIGYAQPKKT